MTTAPEVSPKEARKVFAAVTLGATVEWFDYAVYGVLAPAIALNFFPEGDEAAALLSTYGIFALSFLIRPLGSMFWGSRGDRLGRRGTTAWVVIVMSAATALIGVLPTYHQVGLLAPVLLLALRLVQGFSAGGEMGASSMLFEYVKQRRRGHVFGWYNLASYASSLLALALTAALTMAIGEAAMNAWGWRAIFLIAAPLGLTGLYLRVKLHESPVFARLKAEGKVAATPVRTTFSTQRKRLLAYFGLIMINAVAFYVLNTYLPTYLSENAGVDRATALWASSLISLTMILLQPMFGALSDRFGRKPLLIYACAALFVVSIPMFKIAGLGGFGMIYLAMLLFVLAAAPTSALSAPVGMELFPPALRYSGATIGYNVGYAIFGGTAPYVASWLLDATGTNLAPALYIMGVAVVACVILVTTLPETAPRVLARRGTEVNERIEVSA